MFSLLSRGSLNAWTWASLMYSKSNGVSRRILPVPGLSRYSNSRIIVGKSSGNISIHITIRVSVCVYIYVYRYICISISSRAWYFCYYVMSKRQGQQVNLAEVGMAQDVTQALVSWGWGCTGAAPGTLLDPLALGGWWGLSKHREAPSLFVVLAAGWQFTKGSDASERSPWGGTEEEAFLSPPPLGSKLGKPGRLFLAAWPGNCLWVMPDSVLLRFKLLAVDSVNS